MNPFDYLVMLAGTIATGLLMERVSRALAKRRYDGRGAWAKDSSSPPGGWSIAFLVGIGVFSLLLFGLTAAARIIGA